jgi:hypothetical protein
MTLNLESEISCDVSRWTQLQAEICINVANAKYYAFVGEADRAAEFVRLGFIKRATAADYLHETAIYNQLYFEYGTDRIQEIMTVALDSEAAA